MTTPTARTPSRGAWRPCPVPDVLAKQGVKAYRLGQIRVLSQLAFTLAGDGSGDSLLTWIVSVSQTGRTCPTARSMKKVRAAFGMKDAEEDNHESGIARKLFMHVDPARRVDCECKEDEQTVVREDGYAYQTPHEVGPCDEEQHKTQAFCDVCFKRLEHHDSEAQPAPQKEEA